MQPVKFQTAMLAKEKGFDLSCSHYYVKPTNGKPAELQEGREYSNGYGAKNWDWNLNRKKLLPYPIKNAQCSAPDLYCLQKWLREKHGIYIDVSTCFYNTPSIIFQVYYYKVAINNNDLDVDYYSIDDIDEEEYAKEFDNYEQALEEGLLRGLELI